MNKSDADRLIPTSYRDRISKEFSFPIGAEAVSQALDGVIGYESFWLNFRNHFEASTPDRMRKLVQMDEPILVLECTGASHISIRPVLRENKAAVRELLIDEGLPRLREWLVGYNSWAKEVSDRFSDRRCQLSVRLSEPRLHFREEEYRMSEWSRGRPPREDR